MVAVMAERPTRDALYSKPWLSLEEAAEYLEVSTSTVYRWCEEGKLPFYKLAGTGRRRFKREDLDALYQRGDASDRTP